MTSKVFSREDILSAEQKLIDQGVSVQSLIERAGARLAKAVGNAENVTVMVGGGKNGADGVSASISLADSGINVRIFVVGDKICNETSELLRVAECSGIEIREYDGAYICDDVVLDCLFGIGLNRPITGIYKDAISAINSSGAKIISADIPSGLDADTGKALGECVKADITVSFSGYKLGYFLGGGLDYTGDIILADTGINPDSNISILQEVSFAKRTKNSHKGSYGKVSIIAGCPKFVGASILCERSAHACLRSGAGLCSLCVPNSLKAVYMQRVTESTLRFLPDRDGDILFDKLVFDDIISNSTVIAIGPGLGVSEEIKKIVSYIAENFSGAIVLDADALNSISCCADIIKGKSNIIITPHLGEFSRLVNKKITDINPLEDSINFAKEYGVTVHLKGSCSITATPSGEVTLTASGTPAMAKGGSGDVLTGIVSAFCAMSIPHAVEKASFVHGLAGRLAEKNFGEFGVLARDIADCIPLVMKERIHD